MTKELWEKHSENWGNGCPLMPEENFYKALFDYREWLLAQQQVSVEPEVKVNLAELKNEKLLQDIVRKHLPKAFVGYGQKGFMCQVHYPELCKIINDYTQQQVGVKVNLADIKKEFEELFGEKNFAGRIFIKRNTKAQKIWDWFKEKLKAITTL